jgi:hypothetical protein
MGSLGLVQDSYNSYQVDEGLSLLVCYLLREERARERLNLIKVQSTHETPQRSPVYNYTQ